MTDLTPHTAFGAKRAWESTFGSLAIAENADLALASLAVRKGQTPPALFGVVLPEVGQWTQAGDFAAFWTAPGQWMIEGEGRALDDFAAMLKTHAPGCSITEQTDGWTAFEITADTPAVLVALLEKTVNLDPAQLSTGAAVRTGLEHMSVYLIRRSETHLAVIGMRSFAEALSHALATVAKRLSHAA